MEYLVVNALKKFFVLSITFVAFAMNASAQTSDIKKFILENYTPVKTLDSCKWNYMVLELSNNKYNLLNINLLNKVDKSFEKSIDPLRNYKISELDKKWLPAVVIITIQDNRGLCENVYLKSLTPSDVLQEIIPIISQSVSNRQSLKNIQLVVSTLENPKH